ncbi:acetyl-CoA hydrolase-like protein, partial [Dinothrombium tinctorium]
DTVFIQGAAATPRALVPALAEHGKKKGLKGVKIHHIHTEGPGEYLAPELKDVFRSNSLFTGANCRVPIAEGRADFTPIFLGEIPLLFYRGIIKPDVSLVQVTPADKHGFHSLGTSVDCVRAAMAHSKYIIGQVNPRMPRTSGDATVHTSQFDALVESNLELPEHKIKPRTDVEKAIGKHIAENLVDNGATMQMGIGGIPDAVLAACENHKDLGVHSEMFSDGVVDLVEKGEFIIAQNPKVTAINSCIEVDIVGQVCSDSIGTRVYSGFGGQVDFIRGAALGFDGKGKPILAMPSTTSRGESKIVPFLKQGAGVVTTRAHAHYIVTEYGIAELFGRNYRQRAYALINIAHPDHREKLEKAAFERLKCMPSPD